GEIDSSNESKLRLFLCMNIGTFYKAKNTRALNCQFKGIVEQIIVVLAIMHAMMAFLIIIISFLMFDELPNNLVKALYLISSIFVTICVVWASKALVIAWYYSKKWMNLEVACECLDITNIAKLSASLVVLCAIPQLGG
ncbi:hypothetical protein ACJX0J_012913, partial [Zea mays]